MKIKSLILLGISFAILIAQGYNNRPSEYAGRCSSVYNHQTISVMQGSAALRVRLYNVGDAKTPSGASMSSQSYLASLVLNKDVYVRVMANQGYVGSGGVTGIVFVNGINVNEKLISDGYAYRYGEESQPIPSEPTFGLPHKKIGLDTKGRKSGADKLKPEDELEADELRFRAKEVEVKARISARLGAAVYASIFLAEPVGEDEAAEFDIGEHEHAAYHAGGSDDDGLDDHKHAAFHAGDSVENDPGEHKHATVHAGDPVDDDLGAHEHAAFHADDSVDDDLVEHEHAAFHACDYVDDDGGE